MDHCINIKTDLKNLDKNMAFSCEDYRFVPKVTDMFKQPLLFIPL